MLAQLTIENIAVFQKASIAFSPGFNVFTGETGAGKSILLEAVGAAIGQRTSKDLIRTGETKACVGALFCHLSDSARAALREMGVELAPDDELLLSREITPDGNTCRINGRPATTAMLRAAGAQLIAVHGQQDTQLLAASESHLRFVDAFGRHDGLLERYRASFEHYRAIGSRLRSLETDEAAKARKIDLLRYQIDEITACALTDGEEEELVARRHVIRNAARLTELLFACRENLSGGESVVGAIELLEGAAQQLGEAGRYIADLLPLAQTVSSFGYELQEAARQVNEALGGLEYDPREQDDIEERLEAIGRLKRKYGASIAEILAFCENARRELDEIELSAQTVARLTREQAEALAQANECARALTEARRSSAKRLIEAVSEQLADLDMPAVRMSIEMNRVLPNENGADEAQFLLSVNPGEALRPLAKIASGGELSRIMLAHKNVISGQDDIGTLIFDEIDAGVGGRAAQKVGAKLLSVARERQVICVTHLAQVAAFADRHLFIEKQVHDGRTFTHVEPLDEEGRARELARIMGGEPITPLALQSAAQLLGNARRRS